VGGGWGECRCKERRYGDHIFVQIYFRMHHFVVEFSKFSSRQAARGHWPPNQNPADALAEEARVVCRIDVINVCNVYQKFLINAFVIFVSVCCFNKRHLKCRKSVVA